MKHAKTPHQVDSHTSSSFKIPPNTQDSKICDEKSLLCEQAQGSYLGGNDRRACEAIKDLSRKAESNNPKANAQGKAPRLCDCVEFIYTGKEPYTLRLTSGESFSLKPKEHFIIPRGTLSRWCEYKSTLFTKA